jgi:hypothetical protein
MDELDKQVEYLHAMQRGIDAVDKRRKIWADVSVNLEAHLGTHCKVLGNKVPSFRLAVIVSGVTHQRRLHLIFGNAAIGVMRGPNAVALEKGAQLELGLDYSGIVNVNYHRATIDDEPRYEMISLARLEPAEMMGQIDTVITEFLRRAAEDHWSSVRL